MNVVEWLISLSETLRGTFSTIYEFTARSISVGDVEFTVYEMLFGGTLLVVISWGIISFVIDILP